MCNNYKVITPQSRNKINPAEECNIAFFKKIPTHPSKLIKKIKEGTLTEREIEEIEEFFVQDLEINISMLENVLILGKGCIINNKNNQKGIEINLNYGIQNQLDNHYSKNPITSLWFAKSSYINNKGTKNSITKIPYSQRIEVNNTFARYPRTEGNNSKDAYIDNTLAKKPLTYARNAIRPKIINWDIKKSSDTYVEGSLNPIVKECSDTAKTNEEGAIYTKNFKELKQSKKHPCHRNLEISI